MKHTPKDYKVKMYIPRESVNQNVVIVGERNDEDNAVPSVMKLLEKLTDRGHTSSSDRRKHRGSCHNIPRDESQNESLYGSSTCQDTHTVVEKIVKDTQSPAASCERTGCAHCLKARPSSEPVNKSQTQRR